MTNAHLPMRRGAMNEANRTTLRHEDFAQTLPGATRHGDRPSLIVSGAIVRSLVVAQSSLCLRVVIIEGNDLLAAPHSSAR